MLRSIIVLAAAGMLAACAGLQLQKAEQTEPTGSEFRKQLYAGYVEASQREFQEGDYKDSDYFANKAMLAASGSLVSAERLADRQLPPDKVDELSNAREWLLTGFSDGAIDKVPDAAAKAQVNFDCWIQEQEENFQPEDISACRSAFLKAMGEVQEATREPLPTAAGRVTMAASAAAAASATVRTQTDDIYIVFFAFDSDQLDDEAKAVLAWALRDYPIANPDVVRLEGHTDTSGSKAYNVALSNRRIETVAKALIAGGVNARHIEREALGEARPLIAGANKREARNRRVEIIFY